MSDSLCPIIIIRNLFKVRARATRVVYFYASSETQGQSVGSGERARRKFSSTDESILGDSGTVSLVGRRDESFQVRAKEPLGTDSHLASSKNSSGWRLLIGHKKNALYYYAQSFRELVHDGYCLATVARFVHQSCASKGNFYFLLS